MVQAYGGAQRWRAAGRVEADFDCGGLLFGWKRLSTNYPGRQISAEIDAPRIRINRFDDDGNAIVLDGHDVRLERADGSVLRTRAAADRYFPYGRRLVHWDSLDFGYFLAQAMWNYLVLPGLLLRTDIVWRQLSPSTLEGVFPDHLPTHSRVQQYHFDRETGLLRQYDYTAEAFGGWARAAHLVTEHRTCGDLVYTARRRVLPRSPGGQAFPFPQLIWADIHNFVLFDSEPKAYQCGRSAVRISREHG